MILSGSEGDRVAGKADAQVNESEPPSTFEEFLKKERLSDWPVINDSDTKFDLESERNMLGSVDEIIESFREHAPVATNILDNLDTKIDNLQRRLDVYAQMIVTDETRAIGMGNMFQSPSSGPVVYNAVMEKAANSDAVRAHQKQSRKDKATEMRALILGSKARSVEVMTYPGFKPTELTELPHGLEAPQLLDRVTRAQEFNTGFSKFWRKLFQSEASVAVMQDIFWWFFLDKYERHRTEEQRQIFNRISDSFVALFTSVNPDIKDKFFQVYADCLAQTVFAAYWEAFIDSHNRMDDQFKQEIVSLCSEWVAGVKSQPEAYSHWNVMKLQPKSMSKAQEVDPNKVILMKDGKVNPQADFSINFELVESKDLNALDLADHHPQGSRTETAHISRSQKLNPNDKDVPGVKKLAISLPLTPRESHQIGPGPEFERVHFNLQGRSPLVAHYLHMKGLSSNEMRGRNVRRTEVSRLQSPAPTYREVIRETKKFSKAVHDEYHKISDLLAKELAAIERQKIQQTREIDNLKTQILQHTSDMKIMSEKILDYRGKEGFVAYLKQDREGMRPRRKPKTKHEDNISAAASSSSASDDNDEEVDEMTSSEDDNL
ncbi:protein FAM227B-like [Apostichopus japonicus]|uniref:protein FAM227B-like n=1 Tax=Stichopus japonicus TaxID=307972 RepID=UPI003AB35112